MPETTTPPAPPEATTPPETTPPEGGSGGGETTVPVSALQDERRKRQDIEAELQRLRDAEAERAKAEMSEVERYKTEAEEAKATAERLQADIVTRDKQSWIRTAAAKHGFIDAEDAVARISVTDLEDERAANEAVKALKAKAPHLAGQRNADPSLKQVLKDGERTDTPSNGAPKYTLDQIKSLTPEQAAGDIDEVNRSVAYWSVNQ